MKEKKTDESERAYDSASARKIKRRFFAVIPAPADPNELKRFGLAWQKVVCLRDGAAEDRYIVWNTAYGYEDFRFLSLKLSEICKQRAICVGKYAGEGSVEGLYTVECFAADPSDPARYKLAKTFERISLKTALIREETVRSGADGATDADQTNQSFVFEEIAESPCLASSESLLGAYKRRDLLKEFSAGPRLPT